jgi:calcium-dependent protein kinase
VEQNGTQNNTETKSEKPKRKQAVPVQNQKKTRITVSDGRDNNVIPLGKRTNFGYNRDFAKKYTLGKLLGHGQFGYTYIGIEKATSNRAAIKCIEKKQMKLSISVEDVKREVRILQTLSGHKNIVQFYAAFEDDDKVYIVMELCEGGELLDRILAKYVLRTPPMQICVETIFWTFMLMFDGAGVILCEWPLQGHDHLPCMFWLARADTIFVC